MRLRRAAFALYAAALLLATHWPQLRLPPVGPITRTDVLAHAGAFGLWTLLLAWCAFWPPTLSGRNVRRCAVIAAVYAVLDETSQAIPALNRTVDPADYAANLAGVLLAWIALEIASRRAAR